MREIEFLDRLESPLHVHLRFDTIPIRVETNDPKLHRMIADYFAPFVAEPDPHATRVVGIQGEPEADFDAFLDVPRDKGDPKRAFYTRDGMLVILKKRSGVVYYMRDGHFYGVGDIRRTKQQLTNLTVHAFVYRLRKEGRPALHASAVSAGDLGVAFAGPSGACKSTTGLTLLELGWNFVSNDRIYLGRNDSHEVTMCGVPKWPRVNPGTLLSIENLTRLVKAEDLDRYKTMSASELWNLEEKHDVPVDRVYGRKRTRLRARLHTLFVLSWRRGHEPVRIREVPNAEAGYLMVPLLKTELTDPADLSPPSVVELARQVEGVRVAQVSGGIDVEAFAKQAFADAWIPAPKVSA